MPMFKLQIRDLINLGLSLPTNESSMFKISGNFEEVIEKIIKGDQNEDFRNLTVRDGQVVDGVIRYNAILSLIKNKFEYKGDFYSDFSQEQWDTFNSFVFNVDIDNLDTKEASELFKKLNNIS
ncbi:hypothetical protein IFU39_16535 [Paenibacillus sp. CFBP 13594]|uniref:hypothetical protein n=1 Tax=Paenibacillus sp. CFBP 13594 TaxID=2774037 RepID=UPI00177D2186|nr:hypothetical protein [Paenibacillus sp. CFBP 13594]MBD8839421.1 hypothetical protein [Paenibacillus sp. CFBP 13594]